MGWWGNRTLAEAKAQLAAYDEMVARRQREGRNLYFHRDAVLGWRLGVNETHPRRPYGTNALGNRISGWENDPDAPSRLQVAILGNSHVHGDESSDDESWVHQTQALLRARCTIHNLGVTGYATDQAVLLLEDFIQRQHVDIAVLAITTTDIYRNLNQCRALMVDDSELPLFKPRFEFQKGKATLLPPPVNGHACLAEELEDRDVLARLRRHDAFFPRPRIALPAIARRFRLPAPTIWQQLYRPALTITGQICDLFVDTCKAAHIRPVILFLPVYWGSFPAGPEYDALQAMLVDNTPLIDARQAFSPDRISRPRDELHHRANHYKARTGSWVAEFVAQNLPLYFLNDQ